MVWLGHNPIVKQETSIFQVFLYLEFTYIILFNPCVQVCPCVQACMNSDIYVEGRDNLRCQSLLSTLYETGSLIIHHGIRRASRPVSFWGFSARKPWACRCVLCVHSSAWFWGSKQVLTLATREPSHHPLSMVFIISIIHRKSFTEEKGKQSQPWEYEKE